MISNWRVTLPVAIGTLAHEWLVATCLVAALFVVTPVSALSQAVSPWQPVVVASDRPDAKTPIVESRRVGPGLRIFLVNTTDARIRNIRVWCRYSFGGDSTATEILVPDTLSPGVEVQPDRSSFRAVQCKVLSFEREIKPHARAR
jgi:hypothetical protein